ncbi:hypothetical protein CLU81_0526 [Flavobacterium sp. 9]|uniref:hypothetical protein n=1 Tax=Flavobacterium sp. 9 TaxID=2035198 RepID=UPI000C670CFF|nr:hypothetical protein [Flavobacterium sp. 9]PIF30123.1 hypothetical protein CLU81_0526 [Flavobacterium sp. 9]
MKKIIWIAVLFLSLSGFAQNESYIKNGNLWHPISQRYVKVNGVWKSVGKHYVKSGGTWHLVKDYGGGNTANTYIETQDYEIVKANAGKLMSFYIQVLNSNDATVTKYYPISPVQGTQLSYSNILDFNNLAVYSIYYSGTQGKVKGYDLEMLGVSSIRPSGTFMQMYTDLVAYGEMTPGDHHGSMFKFVKNSTIVNNVPYISTSFTFLRSNGNPMYINILNNGFNYSNPIIPLHDVTFIIFN